jgi:hypothetical protein
MESLNLPSRVWKKARAELEARYAEVLDALDREDIARVRELLPNLVETAALSPSYASVA